MTENGKELEEVRRAHAALESRFDVVIPTLATKADVETSARQLGGEMRRELYEFRDAVNRRFEQVDRRLEEMQARMSEGFNRLAMWMAGTVIAVLVALVSFLSAVWYRTPTPAVNVYPQAPTAAPAGPLATPPQP